MSQVIASGRFGITAVGLIATLAGAGNYAVENFDVQFPFINDGGGQTNEVLLILESSGATIFTIDMRPNLLLITAAANPDIALTFPSSPKGDMAPDAASFGRNPSSPLYLPPGNNITLNCATFTSTMLTPTPCIVNLYGFQY